MSATLPDHERSNKARGQGSDDATASLARFFAPRYWPTWVLVAWLRIVAALPWRAAVSLHECLGRALWWSMRSRRRVVLRNLEICFPELGESEIRHLARRHFESVAVGLAEIALAWFGSRERLAPLIRFEGREHLEAALARGKGVLLLSGHFTPLEICTPAIRALVPLFAFMFKPRKNALLDAVQTRGRLRAGHTSMPNDDVRALLRALAANGVVWYAPDQARAGAGGELIPFFGEPAMTSTAASRIARLSGAAIVPLFFCRLPDRSGYVIRFHAPPSGLPSADATADTARLMKILESFVRECPEQYFWIHRRFRSRPKSLPDAYRTRPRARARAFDVAAAPLAILAVAAFITVFDNAALWDTVLNATVLDPHQAGIVLAVFAVVFCTLVIALALIPGRWGIKAAGAAVLSIAAVAGYYMREYGVVIDASMIRNIAETEMREAAPLLDFPFLMHVAVFGVLPSLGLLLVRLPKVSWLRGIGARCMLAFASALVLAATVYASYGPLAFFVREHHTVRLSMNPGYPLYAFARYVLRADDRPPIERAILPARIAADHAARPKHTLLVFVVGETARADRFSLNGYSRDTNRHTRALGVVNFPHVSSCGTSTAESVPCLFSGVGREHFTRAAAAAHESLFGTFERLGVDAFWRDNSTGCKDVCDPAHFEELAGRDDASLCDSTGCFDEILLDGIDGLVADTSRDHFIVLHQRGSHGPAYHTDTPAWSKQFLPECDLASLRSCSLETVNNAYDNTILYSDYFLSRVIDFLEAQQGDYDVAMLYVSDHGESLGENGLYLHGFPYDIAPQEQKEVPMLFWASPAFYESNGLDAACLRDLAARPVSHDWIYHTLLPLYGVETTGYDSALDLFAVCRVSADTSAAPPRARGTPRHPAPATTRTSRACPPACSSARQR